jgi:HPt (histidine-containing phosphotransfer) domain-containing protein
MLKLVVRMPEMISVGDRHMNQENLLDLALLEGYSTNMGNDILAKMLALYQQQAKVYIAEIAQSLQQQDALLWQEKCHKLKGAAGSVGLKQVFALARDMEKTSADWPAKQQQYHQLCELNPISEQAFEQWLKS